MGLINAGRTAMKRLPSGKLKAIHGPRIPREFERRAVNAIMVTTVQKRFPINFHQTLKFALGKVGIKLD